MGDAPGGAAAMKATAPFGFRYQYLSGGVNTGNGWATWNSNGDFPRFYIQDGGQRDHPAFTYYTLYQSLPGGGARATRTSRTRTTRRTMTAYFNDLKLFFQKAGAFGAGQKVVLHVEPDLWGYTQQRSTGDNATTVPAKVAETGLAELVGLPFNVSGVARAIVRLREHVRAQRVPRVPHQCLGDGNDIVLSNPSDAVVDALAARAATFYNSLAANFDVAFAEFSDRDAGFYQFVYGDGGQHWWDAEDFRRSARFVGGFSTAAGKRRRLPSRRCDRADRTACGSCGWPAA